MEVNWLQRLISKYSKLSDCINGTRSLEHPLRISLRSWGQLDTEELTAPSIRAVSKDRSSSTNLGQLREGRDFSSVHRCNSRLRNASQFMTGVTIRLQPGRQSSSNLGDSLLTISATPLSWRDRHPPNMTDFRLRDSVKCDSTDS